MHRLIHDISTNNTSCHIYHKPIAFYQWNHVKSLLYKVQYLVISIPSLWHSYIKFSFRFWQSKQAVFLLVRLLISHHTGRGNSLGSFSDNITPRWSTKMNFAVYGDCLWLLVFQSNVTNEGTMCWNQKTECVVHSKGSATTNNKRPMGLGALLNNQLDHGPKFQK